MGRMMVYRVARAIEPELWKNWDIIGRGVGPQAMRTLEHTVEAARSILREMSTPSDEMIRATECLYDVSSPEPVAPEKVFRKMVEAALKEHDQKGPGLWTRPRALR